ncbi:hypothetical protein [Actinomadura chibensis]|uniref:DUF4352 domain-containing protein n=1 Tax=Actinomadura chibensis TaxID=392828 RepID=A0A5D0N9G7_9ACTN|nr:hypothetical protein [Actinomadura chibensis]TYB40865.1 hypothetical protein FXF69_38290 [Actinomadura chibensis]
MQSYGAVPPPSPAPPAGRRTRRWAVPLSVGCAAAVLVPVLWVTGGFKETPKEPVKRPGRPLDLGLFDVTVRDARIGLATANFGSARERFLIVRMRVVNKGKETESLGQGGLSDGVSALTRAGKWVRPERIEGVAAGAKTDVVQPGLPVEASAMWKMGPADAPRKLTVGLREWKYDHGFTDSTFNWTVDREDDTLAGRLTLDVAALPVQPQPPAVRTPAGRTPAVPAPRPTGSRR